MSDKYKINDPEKAYFLTMTVVGWVDVFTRANHKLIIVNSLKHCQKEKGLVVYAWCLMSNHLHLIAKAVGNYTLSDILRDFKKYTSKAIIKQIQEEPESRKECLPAEASAQAGMLAYFKKSGEHLKAIKNYKFWQDGNHAKVLDTAELFDQKLNYIHNNPVEDLIVEKPEDYMFSSARNYAGLDNYLKVELETINMITYE